MSKIDRSLTRGEYLYFLFNDLNPVTIVYGSWVGKG